MLYTKQKNEVDPYSFGNKSLLTGGDFELLIRSPSGVLFPVWKADDKLSEHPDFAGYINHRQSKYDEEVVAAHARVIDVVRPVFDLGMDGENRVVSLGDPHLAGQAPLRDQILMLGAEICNALSSKELGDADLRYAQAIRSTQSFLTKHWNCKWYEGSTDLAEEEVDVSPAPIVVGGRHYFLPYWLSCIRNIVITPPQSGSLGSVTDGKIDVYYRGVFDGDPKVMKLNVPLEVVTWNDEQIKIVNGKPQKVVTEKRRAHVGIASVSEYRPLGSPTDRYWARGELCDHAWIEDANGAKVDFYDLARYFEPARGALAKDAVEALNADDTNSFEPELVRPFALKISERYESNWKRMGLQDAWGASALEVFGSNFWLTNSVSTGVLAVGEARYYFQHCIPWRKIGYYRPVMGSELPIITTIRGIANERHEMVRAMGFVDMTTWRSSLPNNLTDEKVIEMAQKFADNKVHLFLNWDGLGGAVGASLSQTALALDGVPLADLRKLEVDGGDSFKTLGELEALNAKEAKTLKTTQYHVTYMNVNSESDVVTTRRDGAIIDITDPENPFFAEGWINNKKFDDLLLFQMAWEPVRYTVSCTGSLPSSIEALEALIEKIEGVMGNAFDYVSTLTNTATVDDNSSVGEVAGGATEWQNTPVKTLSPLVPPRINERSAEMRFVQTGMNAPQLSLIASSMWFAGLLKPTNMWNTGK